MDVVEVAPAGPGFGAFQAWRLGCECVAAALETVAGLMLDQVEIAVETAEVRHVPRIGEVHGARSASS